MTNFFETLTPAKKGLLYGALLFYKEHAEEATAICIIKDSTSLQKQFFRHLEGEVKFLMEGLFGDTHINPEDFINDFNRRFVVSQGNTGMKCNCESGLRDKCPVHNTFG